MTATQGGSSGAPLLGPAVSRAIERDSTRLAVTRGEVEPPFAARPARFSFEQEDDFPGWYIPPELEEEVEVVPGTTAGPPTEPAITRLAARPARRGDGSAFLTLADRLERIAAQLRARALTGTDPEAAGDADPLEILITGYAFGYSEASRGTDRPRGL